MYLRLSLKSHSRGHSRSRVLGDICSRPGPQPWGCSQPRLQPAGADLYLIYFIFLEIFYRILLSGFITNKIITKTKLVLYNRFILWWSTILHDNQWRHLTKKIKRRRIRIYKSLAPSHVSNAHVWKIFQAVRQSLSNRNRHMQVIYLFLFPYG